MAAYFENLSGIQRRWMAGLRENVTVMHRTAPRIHKFPLNVETGRRSVATPLCTVTARAKTVRPSQAGFGRPGHEPFPRLAYK